MVVYFVRYRVLLEYESELQYLKLSIQEVFALSTEAL